MIPLVQTRRLLSVPLLVASAAAAPLASEASGFEPDPWTGPSDLVEIVPPDTTCFWSWRSGEETGLVEERALSVLDAICAAEFDEFAFEAMAELGVDPQVVTELRGLRNVVASLSGVVPWRELVRNEFLFAESNGSGRLIAARPEPGRFEEIERGLAGFLGSAATLMIGPVRYDIEVDDVSGTRMYSLGLRGHVDRSIVRIAVGHGTFLLGTNENYFQTALALLEGHGGHRLIDSERYVAAYGDLDYFAPGRMYIDMRMMSSDLEEMAEHLGQRRFQAGFWQSFLNDTVGLTDSVETIVTTTQCLGYTVSTETWTRFDDQASDMVRAGLAQPASVELMTYVPGDVIAFDMRGDVDPRPVLNWLRERWKSDWDGAENMLWASEVFEAFMGMSLENDVLSWLGSEQVSMTIPHRRSKRDRGWTEDVTLCRVRDPEGTRKCLERVEGIFHALAPPLLEKLNTFLQQSNIPLTFSAEVKPARGDFAELRKLTAVAGMMPFVIHYGMVDDMFVTAASTHALESCLEVARGERPNLSERPLLAGLVGRDDLCSAKMHPADQSVLAFQETLGTIDGVLGQVRRQMEGQADVPPEALRGIELASDLIAKVDEVLSVFDFLGDSITTSEERRGGWARYELTTIEIGSPPIDIRASKTDEVAKGD